MWYLTQDLLIAHTTWLTEITHEPQGDRVDMSNEGLRQEGLADFAAKETHNAVISTWFKAVNKCRSNS